MKKFFLVLALIIGCMIAGWMIMFFGHQTSYTVYRLYYEDKKSDSPYLSAYFDPDRHAQEINQMKDVVVFKNPYKVMVTIRGPFEKISVSEGKVFADGKFVQNIGVGYEGTNKKGYFRIEEDKKIVLPTDHPKEVKISVTYEGYKNGKKKTYHEDVYFKLEIEKYKGNSNMEWVKLY